MVKQKNVDREKFEKYAETYKLLANAKRLEILSLLGNGESIVSDLVNSMRIRKANVSQHLALLRYLKFVKVRRIGKNAFYSLTNPKTVEFFNVMDEVDKK